MDFDLFIAELARAVDARWIAVGCDVDAFPGIARECLEVSGFSERIGTMDPALWAIRAPQLPVQLDAGESFGEPPITAFNNERFQIDLYYWLDGTTMIHEHAFTGAFGVVSGSSMHSHFSFAESRRYNPRLSVGQLRMEKCEHLVPGAVREIHPGEKLIHSLFHLDRPSLSIVVRASAPWTLPQRHFLWPNISIASHPRSREIRKLQALVMMARISHPDFLPTLRIALRETCPDEFAHLILKLRSHLGKTDHLPETLGEIGDWQADLLPCLVTAIKQEKRTQKLIEQRRATSDPEERFLLALLMNLHDRASLVHLATQRWPDGDLAETFRGLFQNILIRGGKPSFDLPDHPDLAEVSAAVVLGTAERLSPQYRELCKQVAKNSIFRPYA